MVAIVGQPFSISGCAQSYPLSSYHCLASSFPLFLLETLDAKCCECSCTDGDSAYGCGDSGFDCRDPACLDSERIAEFPDCTGNWFLIADGTCNAENNVFACGWDGGDVSPFRNADTGICRCRAQNVTWGSRTAIIQGEARLPVKRTGWQTLHYQQYTILHRRASHLSPRL